MQFDHLAEGRKERNFTIWSQNLLKKSPEHLSMYLAAKHRAEKPAAARPWLSGTFNVCYKVRYEDGFEVIVRFASLGRTIFRTEKVNNEVAVMEYLAKHTPIPVPQIIAKGKCWVGPYIIMSFIQGGLLATYLKDPLKEGRPILNPRISDQVLGNAYRGMARLVLELSKPEFSRIGALEKSDSGVWTVTKRPFTLNMNQLSTSANYPPEAFPKKSFGSAAEYFEALATQHLCQLRTQRNDAVSGDADCRKKYVARCLFRKIAQDISVEHRLGPFRLYCDDLRPSNIIINEAKLCIAAVIDWEFAYAAPAEFTYVAPWWLLLEGPQDWGSSLTEFLARYMPRLHLFLETMEECEIQNMKDGRLLESQRLSGRMRESMGNGLFWFCLAARYSSIFDEVYWNFIDKMYYGPFVSIEDRFKVLSEEEKSGLDEFVRIKRHHSLVGTLDNCYSIDDLVDL
jgi:Phosphotransferase enzyme family